MMRMDHERILKAFDSLEDEYHYYVVVEWVHFRLDKIMKRKKEFSGRGGCSCDVYGCRRYKTLAEGLKHLQKA